MTRELQKQCGRLVAKAWSNPELKNRLLSAPAEVMKEHGIELNETDTKTHILAPVQASTITWPSGGTVICS